MNLKLLYVKDKTPDRSLLFQDVIRQYEGHVRQLEALRASIVDKEARAAQLINNMETRENEWKAELNELVNTISANFSRHFCAMKCAGAVELYTGNNEVRRDRKESQFKFV